MGITESDSEGKDPKEMSLSELVETLALAATRFGDQVTHIGQKDIAQDSLSNILKRIRNNYETAIKPYKEELDKRERAYLRLTKSDLYKKIDEGLNK